MRCLLQWRRKRHFQDERRPRSSRYLIASSARELDEPFQAISSNSVRATLEALATAARSTPTSTPMHMTSLDFGGSHPEFATNHFRSFDTQSSTSLPQPCLDLLLHVATELFSEAKTTKEVFLRKATWDIVLLLSTLALDPQRLDATSSAVKAEGITRLDLRQLGHLDELASIAKVHAHARPSPRRSRAQRAARRATRTIHKKKNSIAASLAASLGVAEDTTDTLHFLESQFPKPKEVFKMHLFGFYDPP
jgi:hypothetical protein